MEIVGSAVGVASLGIQVCQGLISYYESWKNFDSEISETLTEVYALHKTLISLKETLNSDQLDENKTAQAKSSLETCRGDLDRLHQEVQKIHTYHNPQSRREKAHFLLQRSVYPFRSSTLTKLRATIDATQPRLQLAVQALLLNVGTDSQKTLQLVAANTTEIASRSLALQKQSQEIVALHRSHRFSEIYAWLSPPNPQSNHDDARRRHEPDTGNWLLESDQYREWNSESDTTSTPYLWIHGKVGCGKTILSSTIIEDVRVRCAGRTNVGFAFFYFTFSDKQKQSCEMLIRSLVAQMGHKEPGLSMLQNAFNSRHQSSLEQKESELVILSCIETYDRFFIVLDALDECPEHDAREMVMKYIDRLCRSTTKLRLLATSRLEPDLRDWIKEVGFDTMAIDSNNVNDDILKYVRSQLFLDSKLDRLDTSLKAQIEKTISEKADGMFRWAYCQLQELRKLKSKKPKYIREALRALPRDLDDTYDRILNGIDEMFQQDAFTLLQWLAYADSPPTLAELSEATIIDPTGEGTVEFDERGDPEDTLRILSGLVIAEGFNKEDFDDGGFNIDDDSTSESAYYDGNQLSISKRTKVRLAHVSVKEYLESDRILRSGQKKFQLARRKGHKFLAESCLTYLISYSSRNDEQPMTKHDTEERSATEDPDTFPLLRYAACVWFHHSAFKEADDFSRELLLLNSQAVLRNWARAIQNYHEGFYQSPKDLNNSEHIGTGLYYASLIGLLPAVEKLLETGADVNAKGGESGYPLQAASAKTDDKVITMLLGAGADVNAQGGRFGNALQMASYHGWDNIVQILLDAKANVEAQGGCCESALLAASGKGHHKVVQKLLQGGADVNGRGKSQFNALQLASLGGYEKTVQMLLDKGAEVNFRSTGWFGTALEAAAAKGHEYIVQMLLDAGAHVDSRGEHDQHNALQIASLLNHEKIVQILLDAGADVNDGREDQFSALMLASSQGNESIVRMLLGAGADIHAKRRKVQNNALEIASFKDHGNIVAILLDAGADANIRGGTYGNPLQAAAASHNSDTGPRLVDDAREEVVRVLLHAGADVNAQGGILGTALQAAVVSHRMQIVQMLLDAGADVNLQGGHLGTALQAAAIKGWEQAVHMLINQGADINAQGGYFGTALQAATAMNRGEVIAGVRDEARRVIVKILLKEGADVNARGGYFGTALQAAAIRADLYILRTLLDAGAEVNIQEGHYGTALQAAAIEGEMRPVRMLLDAGADVNLQGGHYESALRAAEVSGNERLASYLLQLSTKSNTQEAHQESLQAAPTLSREHSVESWARNPELLIETRTPSAFLSSYDADSSSASSV